MTAPPHGLTAAEVAVWAQIDPSTPNLQAVVDAAVESLRRRCGWHVFPVARMTLTLDGDGGEVATLPTLRVVELHSVTDDGQAMTAGVDYDLSGIGDLKRRGSGCWSTRWSGLVVDLTHGFDTPVELVREIAGAVGELAVNPLGIPETVGPFSWGASSVARVGGGFSLAAAEVIDRYRIWSA